MRPQTRRFGIAAAGRLNTSDCDRSSASLLFFYREVLIAQEIYAAEGQSLKRFHSAIKRRIIKIFTFTNTISGIFLPPQSLTAALQLMEFHLNSIFRIEQKAFRWFYILFRVFLLTSSCSMTQNNGIKSSMNPFFPRVKTIIFTNFPIHINLPFPTVMFLFVWRQLGGSIFVLNEAEPSWWRGKRHKVYQSVGCLNFACLFPDFRLFSIHLPPVVVFTEPRYMLGKRRKANINKGK